MNPPTECLTPKIWRTKLLEVIGDYIGTYTYNSGGNEVYRPAVSIGNPRNEITVCGIEIVIPLAPRVVDQYLAGKTMYTKQCWDIRILQRTPDSKGMVLPLVIERLQLYFHETYGVYESQKKIDQTYEQYLWQVYTYELKDPLTSSDIAALTPWAADV